MNFKTFCAMNIHLRKQLIQCIIQAYISELWWHTKTTLLTQTLTLPSAWATKQPVFICCVNCKAGFYYTYRNRCLAGPAITIQSPETALEQLAWAPRYESSLQTLHKCLARTEDQDLEHAMLLHFPSLYPALDN